MKKHHFFLLLTLPLSALTLTIQAQTTEYSLRSSVDLELKVAKGLKFAVTPEYRYNPGSGAGSVLVQAGLNYKVARWLSVGGYYRLDGEKVEGSGPRGHAHMGVEAGV